MKKWQHHSKKTKLNGTVVDETGEAIIGANVIVKGTTNGCTTDLDGHFTLDVDHLPATLMVSYIGYIRQEIKVTSAKTIKVEMAPDNNLMDEVVITGYGTFKKICLCRFCCQCKRRDFERCSGNFFLKTCFKVMLGRTVHFFFRSAGGVFFFENPWYGFF